MTTPYTDPFSDEARRAMNEAMRQPHRTVDAPPAGDLNRLIGLVSAFIPVTFVTSEHLSEQFDLDRPTDGYSN